MSGKVFLTFSPGLFPSSQSTDDSKSHKMNRRPHHKVSVKDSKTLYKVLLDLMRNSQEWMGGGGGDAQTTKCTD